MKKAAVLFFVILIASLLAGLYGIINDQITYTISPEYYTKFKFYQFGLIYWGDEVTFPHPRLLVAMVGFMATWWVGLIIGIILGLINLMQKNYEKMFSITMKAFGIAIAIAFITGIIGLLYGYLYLVNTEPAWYFPDDLINRNNFIIVGSIHNFSYIGGILGLIASIIYSIIEKRNNKYSTI